MGVIQLPDELQQVIERQVAAGRAANPTAFLEEAVRRLVDEAMSEEDDLRQVAVAGSHDIAAGRFTTVATAEDGEQVYRGMLERLQAGSSADT